jgi:hypothetical protein
MKTTFNFFIGFLVAIPLFFPIRKFYDARKHENETISAEFIFLPSEHIIKSNERLTYLYSIAIVLDRFKNDHNYYPITSNGGEGWSVIHVSDQGKISWIDAIIPAYTQNLPYRPIKEPSQNEQYAYQSDGANYKLVVYYPPDCDDIRDLNSIMTKNDAEDKCIGYGLWTKRSKWDTNPPLE